MLVSPFAIGAAAAAFLPLVLLRRPLALAAFCGLIVLYPARFIVPVANIPSTLVEVLFWMLFVAWLADTGREAKSWSALRRWAVPLTLLLTGATIGVLVAPDLRAALGVWRAYFLEPILFFPMLVDTLTRHKNGRQVLTALAAAATAIGVIAIIQKLTGIGIPNPYWQAAETRRVTALFGFPNAIGLFLAPVVVLLTGWLAAVIASAAKQSLKPSERFLRYSLAMTIGASVILGLLAVLFAVSEGAAAGIAAALAIYFLAQKSTRRYALGVALAGLIAVLAVPQLNRYALAILTLSDDSGSVRRIVWSASAKMLADNPVFGAGLSGYPFRLVPYHDTVGIEIFQYPHNIVMNFWSEVGLIGLIGIVWIVARYFHVAYGMTKKRSAGWLPLAAICAMLAILVHGLVDVPYFKNDLAFLFWILVALVDANAAVLTAKPEPKPDPHAPPPLPPIFGNRWS